jgi:signal transduction histidine kinase
MNLSPLPLKSHHPAAVEDLNPVDLETLQVLVAGFIVLGAFIILLAEPLSVFFQGGVGKEAPFLGLLLVVMAIISYGVSVRRLQRGLFVLIGSTAMCVVLAIHWGFGPGSLNLLLLPVFLAVAFASRFVSTMICIGTLLLIYGSSFLPLPFMAAERFTVSFLILAIWLLFLLVELRRTQTLNSFLNHYNWAKRELEDARDDRLRIHQLNEDLAQAYGQLRRLNEMLQASKLEAEAARQAKEEFVAKVSHELRTPLNMIIGFSEMIISSPETYSTDLPRALLSDIGVIHRNSQHLSQLINDVLVLSQVNAGQMSLTRSWVEIDEVIGEAVHAIEPLFRTKGLSLEVSLPDTTVPVYCDRLRIRQVLLNLLSNAGRYTLAGGAEVIVDSTDQSLVVAVRDTGPGIPPEEQKRVFEPFQQLDEPGAGRDTGSGLGLTISQHLVQLHGGRMWLESQTGRGATFYFSLPSPPSDMPKFRVVLRESPYSTYLGDERRSLPALPVPKDRLIVLEREVSLSRHFSALLPEAEVIMVDDVRKLSEEAHQNPPTAVIINDPGAMDDISFSRQLLHLPERTPILSCYVPGHREAVTELNIVDYLVKPVTRPQLLNVVAGVVGPGSTILCVEDNVEVARLMRRQLSSAGLGYRILEASHGAGAIEMIQTRHPDMVLLDLGLPDQDGYEILRRKNADPLLQPIPVAVISARDPLGGPVVTSRLRVELVGGLSLRDITECTTAITGALLPKRRSTDPGPPEKLPV